MAKEKSTINKQSFDINSIKKQFSSSSKMKPNEFLNCGEAFTDACGIPGPAVGHLNMFIGHSDTGKTTALIKAAIDAQRKGKLPIFIITEKKWDFEHAQNMGLDCYQNENGEWDGQFLFNDNFDYIEQIFDYINQIIDEQEKENIPMDTVFFWDSLGSIQCKMNMEGGGGNMHNARVISEGINSKISGRITRTRKEEVPYTSTLVLINQPYVTPPDNPYEAPEIETKGGKSTYQACSIAFLFGGKKKAGVNEIQAVNNKRRIAYAKRTKVQVLKNHVNGYTFKDGKLIITEHGFIRDNKKELDNYKEQYKEYWSSKLGSENFALEEESSEEEENEETEGVQDSSD
jgi:hypothetical protein